MSLAAAALRIITVKALDNATTAGDRVFDSVVDPVDLLGDAAAPTIVVYTDKGRRKVTGRDLFGADHVVTLGLELFVAKATLVASDGEGQGAGYQIEYPATDAGLENRLRRLAYEIESVLTGSAEPWAMLWRRVVVRFCPDEETMWDRGADAEKTVRFNFLRGMYPLEPIADPVRGAQLSPGEFWYDLLAAMDADVELAELARDWRALITTPNLPAWRKAMSELGLSYRELQAIGLAPLLDHQASNLSESGGLQEMTLDPEALVVDTATPDYKP